MKLTKTSLVSRRLLGSTHIVGVGTTAGSAALSVEGKKHANNDKKCTEFNWVCVSMAVEVCVPKDVEVYGAWGAEAQHTFSRLAMHKTCCRLEALSSIYTRINLTLVRANARALLSRVSLG